MGVVNGGTLLNFTPTPALPLAGGGSFVLEKLNVYVKHDPT